MWAAQEPLDKRVFDFDYSDVELLGKAVTRGDEWPAVGLLIHIANGAAFGAATRLRPFCPGRLSGLRRGDGRALRRLAAGTAGGAHPSRARRSAELAGNPRALAQATWRHVLFAVVLGVLEERLNHASTWTRRVPVSSNGHGDIEAVATATATSE